jgi:DNA-binding beta-propeller fold protein YncE
MFARLRWKPVHVALLAVCVAIPLHAWKKETKKNPEVPWPELLMDGGRKLTYQQTLISERDILGQPGFWTKVVNFVAGEKDYRPLVRPYSVAVDSRGRMIVTDPGAAGVHIFDPAQHKYKFLDRQEKSKDPMIEPQCVAVDAKDNIYVTDSKAGKVFWFEANGKYRGAFGSLKGGEGFFKRPTGIAIDSETQNIYVTDTLRNRVYVLDPTGKVMRTFGQSGSGNGEFNLPTEIHIKGDTVAVVDAMNFRIQIFNRNGAFQGAIGAPGQTELGIFRPKALAIDSEDHIYLVEGQWGLVQVFNREGQLLYHFGNGTGFGNFRLPSGLFIDHTDHIYLVDSYNRRVQIFQYFGLKEQGNRTIQ